MAVYAPRAEEIALICFNTNIDDAGVGDWYQGDSGFLKNFFANTVYYGIREGNTGAFAYAPNRGTKNTVYDFTSHDAQTAHTWYLGQFGGNLIWELHLARAAAPFTRDVVTTYGPAEDAKVWSADKPDICRFVVRTVANHYHSIKGKYGIRVWLCVNEGDLYSDDICRVATDRQATTIARLVQLDRIKWEELRGPSAQFTHPGVIGSVTSSSQALRNDAGGTYRVKDHLAYNNGEVLKYIDAWCTSNHHRNSAFEDGPDGIVGSAPANGIHSFYWLWRAIKAGQTAYGPGAPLIPVLATEYGNSSGVGNYNGTTSGDWITDDLTLNGKNILRTYRMGLAVNSIFYWGVTLASFYSMAWSPAGLNTGSSSELERSRGATYGTQNLYYYTGANALQAHQPEGNCFARVSDMRRYLLPPDGIIPIPTKTWQYDPADLDNGFHVPYTWAVCATAYNAPTGTSLSVPPWPQWLNVTFPGAGEIVSAAQAGVHKIICRPVFLPRHTQWTVKADIQCTGGGVARLAVRGYDLLDGEAFTVSPNATAVYSATSVNFRPRGHSLRLPNAARCVIVLHHNGVGVARLRNVVVYPTGTAPPGVGDDPLDVSASVTPATGAAPLAVTFSASAAGGTAPYTYRWDFGDGSAVSTAQNPVHTYALGGTYTATVTVTDAAAATSTDSATITATAALAATASASPLSGDAPLAVTFTGGATGGTAPYTYAWTFGDGGASAIQNPTRTYAGVGRYTALLTVTDAAAVQATAAIAINVTLASTDLCRSSTSNLFLNPCNAATATKRPIGTGAIYAGAGHQYTTYWLKGGSAAGKVFLNAANSGWGCGFWDASSAAGTFLTTVTYAGNPNNTTAKAQFPVTVRLPNGFNSSFNGPPGMDNSALIWDGASFHDFYRLSTVTQGSKYTGESHYTHAGGGQGHGGSPRGTPASGIWFEGVVIRGHEWNDPAAGKCEHMLGIALGSKSTHSVGPQLGKTFAWPATSGDGGMASNDGVIPYGTIFAIPPPDKGGPNPADLGLGAADSIKARLYWQARNYGWVVIDQADNPVFRCDQALTEATRAALQAAARALYPHLRAVTNVGATGSNPIGGGAPLAPNCAFNRPSSGSTTQPVSWWEAKYSASADLAQFQPNSLGNGQPKDSWPMYELGLGVDGNFAMYRATKKTQYLDRALLYIENCINRAVVSNAENFPKSQFKDGYRGWISLSHPEGSTGLEQALYEFYMWRYVMQGCYHARNQPGYQARIAAIIAFTETHIWQKWYGRGSGQLWLYREVVHISAHTAMVALYLREMAASATIRAQCQTVLDNIDHVGMSLYTQGGVKASFRNQLKAHPENPNAYYWNAYWPSRNVSEPYGSDQDHADAFITYAIAAYEQGYGGWSLGDIGKLRALSSIFWPSRGVYYRWLIGAAGGLDNEGNFNDGTVKHGGFDAAFQKRVEDHITAPSAAAGTQMWGNGALSAARLRGAL